MLEIVKVGYGVIAVGVVMFLAISISLYCLFKLSGKVAYLQGKLETFMADYYSGENDNGEKN